MKTKKLVAAILTAVVCAGTMSGCGGENTDTTNAESEFVMVHYEYIKGANDVQVYVHRETNFNPHAPCGARQRKPQPLKII